MSTELVPHTDFEMPVATTNDPQDLLRVAVQRGADVGTLERLMSVRRELRDEQAKAEFDLAMAAFQSECPIIEKKKAVMQKNSNQARYHYAPLDSIVSQVRPLLKEFGFSYAINAVIENKSVKAICTVTHRAGHSRSSEFQVPIDPDSFMNEPQKYASALTFAKRYAFCNAFGILTGDEDTDANTARPKPAGPNVMQGDAAAAPNDVMNKRKLVDMTRSIHMCAKGYGLADDHKARLTQYLIDECLLSDTQTVTDLTGAPLAAVVEKLEKKLKR